MNFCIYVETRIFLQLKRLESVGTQYRTVKRAMVWLALAPWVWVVTRTGSGPFVPFFRVGVPVESP